MPKIICIFYLLLSYIQASAQELIKINGNLITSDGQPAAGVQIYVKGNTTTTYSDHLGNYELQIPKGENTLVFDLNMQTQEHEYKFIAYTNQTLAQIQLQLVAHSLNQVAITGQYTPQTADRSVFNIRTINQEKINARAATNILQLLTTEPGFRLSNDLTLGTADIELMGMSGRNVKILVDGIPMLDRSDTRESLSQIDINLVERIEIIEGPMSVLYGSDALAGVINIITKNKQGHNYGIQAKIQEETVGKEYEFLKEKGIHYKNITTNWANKWLYTNVSITANQFGGWNAPNKTALIPEVNAIGTIWKPKDQLLGNLKVGYQEGKFNLTYNLLAMQEDINTRTGINPTNYIGKIQTYHTDRINHQIQGAFKFNRNSTIQAIAGLTNLKRKTTTLLHDYNNNQSNLSQEAGEQDLATFSNLFLRSTYQQTISKIVSFQTGIEYNSEKGNGARIKGTPIIKDYAIFVSTEYKPISYLTLRPGARYIHNTVYNAPALIPAINTKLAISSNFNLRLSYAKGYRAPALRELFFDFVDANHTILGNENLKAETSNSWNSVITWIKTSKNSWDSKLMLSTFYNVFKDRIDYGIDENNPTITTLLNIDKYKTTGITFSNELHYKGLQTSLGVTYIGRYNQLSETINEVSSFSWTAEIFAETTYYIKKWNASANLFFKYTGKRPSYQIENNNPNTASLIYIDHLSWIDFIFNKKITKSINLNIGVKNILNITNLNRSASTSDDPHGSTNTVSTSYGRSFVMGVKYNWTK